MVIVDNVNLITDCNFNPRSYQNSFYVNTLSYILSKTLE